MLRFGWSVPGSMILPTTPQLRRKSLYFNVHPGIRGFLTRLANNNVLVKRQVLPHNGKRAMLTSEQINDLHRLYWSELWPVRKIERHLHMGWRTIRKYLEKPDQTPLGRPRLSKLDPFKTAIAEFLEKDPSASAAVSGG